MEFIKNALFDNFTINFPAELDYQKYLKQHEDRHMFLQRQEELEEKERILKRKKIKQIEENYKRMINNLIEVDRNRDRKVKQDGQKFKDNKRIADARRWLRQTPPPNFYLLKEEQQLSLIILFGLDNGERQTLEDTAKILGLTCLETLEQSYEALQRLDGRLANYNFKNFKKS